MTLDNLPQLGTGVAAMPTVFRTVTAQVAEHLRAAVSQGRWKGVLPGRGRLAEELGVNQKTVEAALRQLEREGFLVNPGKGHRRRIKMRSDCRPPALRVAILLGEAGDRSGALFVELRHRLEAAGHTAFYPAKTLVDLGMNPARIAGLVSRTPADAWVVTAGSLDVLAWFARLPVPVFALFGPMRGFRIAGAVPNKAKTLAQATRALLELGHRRICFLVRPRRRLPAPGMQERAFLAELEACGCQPSAYHLPEWDESIESFHRMLERLFHVTPPTALIVDEAAFFVSVMQFCLGRRLRVPEDVSLVCTDDDPAFAWCHRPITHIAWDSRPVIRRVIEWANNVGRGKIDLRQTISAARFVPGATMGPAKTV
jgi:hypothetical protein